jgi:hypothetical protein
MLTSNIARASVALLCVAMAWGCSKASSPAHEKSGSGQASTSDAKLADRPTSKPTATPPPTKSEKPSEEVSRIIGKADVTVHGKPSCKIDFTYVGFESEDLFWDGETCAHVTAQMINQVDLERLGKWQRLDDFERRQVNQLPGGKVLYVEGAFAASIYPVGTTRLSYEVSVAD